MLFEMPDRRAVWWMLGVISIGFVHVISITVDERSFMARASEYALYCGFAALGLVLGYLSVREGFSIVRPSRTRESQPVMYWMDIAAFLVVFPAAGAWMTWKALENAS